MSTRGWEHVQIVPRKVREARQTTIAARPVPPSRSKYGAVRTTVDGWTFDSKKEARRYAELLALGYANLELQPVFPLLIHGCRVGTYRADFAYDTDLGRVIEDCKGFRTATYRLKKRMVEAQYGVRILET